MLWPLFEPISGLSDQIISENTLKRQKFCRFQPIFRSVISIVDFENIRIFSKYVFPSELYSMQCSVQCSSLYLSFYRFNGSDNDNQILHYCFYRIFNTKPSLNNLTEYPSLLFLFHFLQLKITVWFGFIRCVQFCAVAPSQTRP